MLTITQVTGTKPEPVDSPTTSDVEVAASNVIDMAMVILRDMDQSYYWTRKWQAAERLAREDLATGQFAELSSPDEVEEYFDTLAGDGGHGAIE